MRNGLGIKGFALRNAAHAHPLNSQATIDARKERNANIGPCACGKPALYRTWDTNGKKFVGHCKAHKPT